MSAVVNTKFDFDESLVDESSPNAKFAVIIDHKMKKLKIAHYVVMYQLINHLLRSGNRFTIHRIFIHKPDENLLSQLYNEIF